MTFFVFAQESSMGGCDVWEMCAFSSLLYITLWVDTRVYRPDALQACASSRFFPLSLIGFLKKKKKKGQFDLNNH